MADIKPNAPDGPTVTLMKLNDDGKSFTEIADYIQENL